MEVKEPTYKEVCEKLKLDFQCSRCGSKVVDRKGHLACDCRGMDMMSRWKQCFEQARQEIIRSRTPLVTEKDESAKTRKAIDDFIDYCDN